MDQQQNYPTIEQFVAIEKKTAAIMAMPNFESLSVISAIFHWANLYPNLL